MLAAMSTAKKTTKREKGEEADEAEENAAANAGKASTVNAGAAGAAANAAGNVQVARRALNAAPTDKFVAVGDKQAVVNNKIAFSSTQALDGQYVILVGG